jgi:uncharacterized delta-60 repeat protein
MFEILKTTRTGRQMLRTATKTLGSASAVAALIGFAGGLGIAQTAGSLDSTFGTGGIVMQNGLFEGQNVMPLTAIEQPGGDIVVILGINNIVATEAFGLARFTSRGKLDTTFGTKGVTMVGFTDFINEPNSVAVQPDGDIVVVGFSETTSGGFAFAMARFTPNGQLDDTFGNGGLVTVQPPGIQPSASVVMVQPNGQIIEGGSVIGINPQTPGGTVLGRYNSDGSLDTTFGTNGFAVATTDVGSPTGLALLANGSYLALGNFTRVVEFSSTGVLQSTVTADTVVATSRPGQAFANPVLIQPSGDFIEGRMIGAGAENTDDQIFRFSETGVMIPSFDTTAFGFPGVKMNFPLTLALQSNGKILVGGVPFGLARLNTDGELDTTFGSGGMVETPAGASLDGLLIQTDRKIVAIGGGGPNGTDELILARYLAN